MLFMYVEKTLAHRHMRFDPKARFDGLPLLPPKGDLENKVVLKACVEARAALASLKQATALIPNPTVLINTIPLLGAQASSTIENVVTTTDALGWLSFRRMAQTRKRKRRFGIERPLEVKDCDLQF